MACGQSDDAPLRSWGVAPGYGAPRPMAWGDGAPLRTWGVAPGYGEARPMAWKKDGLEKNANASHAGGRHAPKRGFALRGVRLESHTPEPHPDPGSQRLRSGRGRRPRLSVA